MPTVVLAIGGVFLGYAFAVSRASKRACIGLGLSGVFVVMIGIILMNPKLPPYLGLETAFVPAVIVYAGSLKDKKWLLWTVFGSMALIIHVSVFTVLFLSP